VSAAQRKSPAPKPRFFATQAAWRKWLAANHAKAELLWVGFWKVTCGKPSITWPQSVDEALCFGWIDGLRKSLDAESYMIRFSPRKATSKWSRVNLKRFAELEAAGLVHATGRAARAKWDDAGEAGYSHERGPMELDAASAKRLRANAKAWAFWQAQIPSYRKMVAGWLLSPKREETRTKRIATTLAYLADGKSLHWKYAAKPKAKKAARKTK